MLSNFSCVSSSADLFSNSLDPDRAQHFVGPDLGPNCLQTEGYRRQRVKLGLVFGEVNYYSYQSIKLTRVLLSCQPRVTVTSCFVYIIRDL